MKRIISVALLVAMILTTLISALPTTAAEQEGKVLFEDGFDYDGFGKAESIYDEKNIWQKEFKSDASDNYGYRESSAPQAKDGVLKFNEGDGIRLNWANIDGFSFSNTKTYTITFDFKVTDFGDDEPLSGSPAWNREVYFAVAGYYNQIECRSSLYNGAQSGFRAGDKTAEYPQGGWTADASGYTVGTTYHAIIEWIPAKSAVVSTIMNGNTIIAKGIRTSGDYSSYNKYTRSFVWRCEDGKMEVDNVTFSDGANTYTQDFTLSAGEVDKDTMCAAGLWAEESSERMSETTPVLDGGLLKLGEKSSVAFNWLKVDGINGYNANTTYTFDFDVKITDKGDGSQWGGIHYTRALYVGFGGWFTFIEMPNKDGLINAGSKTVTCTDATYLNANLHVSLVWEGASITATITDASGKVIATGTRTSSDFTDMVVHNSSMTYLVIRCEDGAAEVDNFKFTAENNEPTAVTDMLATGNNQLIYEADVDYTGEGKVTFKLGSKEIVAIAEDDVRMCSRGLQTSYGAGNYKVKVFINAKQKMLSVELTMPDGSIARRGYYAMLGSNTMYAYAKGDNEVKNIKVKNGALDINEYNLTTSEPSYSGFKSKVYNLVTSFDVAQTTRNFAWTAKTSYLSGAGMALQYRVSGSDTWTEVDAVKEKEAYDTPDEDYFKCDLTGLQPDTEYEYRIGKKGSTAESDWSDIYSFKTAPEKIDSFSFIAIGDTQGITWGGTTVDQKGFMYAKAAYEEAFEALDNPAFILHTGDVVESGGNKNMWNMYFKALGDYGTRTPMFVTMGNHDTWTDTALYFDHHFNHPNNGGTAALDSSITANITDSNLLRVSKNADETIYSYNYGDAHFIVLNTGSYCSQDMYLIEAQRDWLIKDLNDNANAKWKVILIHEPVYHRLGGSESRPWLFDVIESYGVDLVMQGHSHLVTRSYPMKNGEIVTKQNPDEIQKGTGTIYTTIGSTALNKDGTGDASNVEEMMAIVIPEAEQAAFTTVEVSDEKLSVVTKQLNGLVLDSFSILADPSDDNPGDDQPGDDNPGENKPGETDKPTESDKPAQTDEPTETDKAGAENTEKPTEDMGTPDHKKKGCGSSLELVSIVAIASLGFGVTALKKKNKD